MADGICTLPNDSATLLSLIRLIYEAVETPAHWHTVMERIAESINGEWTVLWPSYSDPAETAISAWGRLDPAVLPAYVNHYASVNVIAQRIEEAHPKTLVSYSHEVISDSELQKSEYYNDYLRPNHLFYTFGITIDLGLETPSVISSLRPKSAGPFGETEASILTALMPHIRQALRLNRQFGRLRSETEGLHTALNAFDVALFGLNANGMVVFHNHSAQEIIRAGDGVVLSKGRLVATHSVQNADLQNLLMRTADTGNGSGTCAGGAVLLTRKSGKPPLRLSIVPFSPSHSDDFSKVVTLVFVADLARPSQSRATALRALHALTPTEAKLADCLIEGLELKVAAERLRLTENTARFHLKQIFRKSGVRSQSALIRLSLGIPGQS